MKTLDNTKITLYLAQKILDKGFDICDKIWDWGTYFEMPSPDIKEEELDYYDKCMRLFALNIEFEKYQKDWYSICNVADFIWDNKKKFDKFFNEVNSEDWQPKNWNINDKEDEEFYDTYLYCFEQLVNGNYSEEDYKRLYEILLNIQGE